MSHRSPVPQKDSDRDTIASADTTVSVRYTGITAESLLTKRIWRGEHGALVKQAAARSPERLRRRVLFVERRFAPN